MKYDRRAIMMNAWNIRRNNKGMDMSASLREAWRRAKVSAEADKREAELDAQCASYIGAKFEDGMGVTLGHFTFTLSRWNKYGKDRVYINDGTRDGCGYVDLVARRSELICSAKGLVPRVAKAILSMTF